MSKASPFTDFLHALRAATATFPDIRKGKNKHYTVRDAALGAFAVFGNVPQLLIRESDSIIVFE